MPDTVVGLFRNREDAEVALRKLKGAGLGPDQVALSTPRIGRRGRYGVKVLAGIVIGTVLGAIAGAIATGLFPGVRPLVSGNLLATFLLAATAGAAAGGLAGGLFAMAASGDRALYYEQEVQAGRFLVSVAAPRLDEARAILIEAGAIEAAPVEAPMEPGRPRPESG